MLNWRWNVSRQSIGELISYALIGSLSFQSPLSNGSGVLNMNAMWRRPNISSSWIGKISTSPTGGAFGCGIATPLSFTPGWCTGGIATLGTGDGMMNSASGIFLDAVNNNLYVADTGNHRVSKYVASTGVFVGAIGKTTATSGTCPASGPAPGWCTGGTFASGGGDGMMNGPTSVFVDSSSGFLYVADSVNFRVDKYMASTGAFVGAIGKTTATSGTCPASGPAPGWCTGGTFASGGGDGMMTIPQGVFIDTSGYLYVSDLLNARVIKFTASTGAFVGAIGKTTATSGTCPASGPAPGWCTGGTFASGSADGTMNGPRGILVDNNGYLYVADSVNFRVDKYMASTGAFVGAIGKTTATSGTCPASGAAPGWCTGGTFASGSADGTMNGPSSITTDPNGNLYIADMSNNRIIKVKANTGAFIGWMGKISSPPSGGAAACKNAPLTTTTPGWCSGGTGGIGTADGMLSSPMGITYFNFNDSLYITDANSRVTKYNKVGP